MENSNSFEYLEKIKAAVIENLRHTVPAPSVQMQDVPRHSLGGAMTDEEEAELDDLDEDENPDTRLTQRRWDQRTQNAAEYEESDDEDMDAAHGKTKPRNAKKRTFTDFGKTVDETTASGVETPVNGTDLKEDAPNAEPHVDADVSLDKPVEEEDATDKEVAPVDDSSTTKPDEGAGDKDGDVEMDNATDATDTVAIKGEEAEGEGEHQFERAASKDPIKESKPASRQASPEKAVADKASPQNASGEQDAIEAPKVSEDQAPKEAGEKTETAREENKTSEGSKENDSSDKMDVDEKPVEDATPEVKET